jgi:hypothetical protein
MMPNLLNLIMNDNFFIIQYDEDKLYTHNSLLGEEDV